MARKKVFLFVFGVVMLFGSYVGWKLYQDSTRVIIPLEELQGITVSPIKGDFSISGTANISNFERVSNYQAKQTGNDVYLYFMKTKSIFKDDAVDLKLSRIIIGDVGSKIKNIYLISGENIIVKTSSRSTDYLDIENRDKEKLLFSSE
ncbi:MULTISPECIES: hypothetical protein [Streptococcus]|uniref:Uncharacterized protein n=1 Tax=Streptococcus ruminantium TaxID=1917441 RepID=A0A2Z5U5S9_9STRE|nr:MULTISPECIES: hypothetical protein [Streptococcus]MDQ8759712.1 hypothetical protein [Streptococcus ruminantium]MDQ8766652.1 hypothetical protein [Streptococcus ruminantium]MDQ8769133.1 hypothetical protein [Streptococcus ruminantium]MDQ8774586.1 hypothetical protein [Streptococcus ruminantium]MDQ8793417.1 hypothetical protein [Streptococcus ruminantium]